MLNQYGYHIFFINRIFIIFEYLFFLYLVRKLYAESVDYKNDADYSKINCLFVC